MSQPPVATVIVIAQQPAMADVAEVYGPEVAARVEAIGGDVLAIEVVPIGGELLEERVRHYVEEQVPLVLTCGGSAIGPDDIVPELTAMLVERRVPGVEQLLRGAVAADHPEGAFERGVCGISADTLIVNLPRPIRLIESSLAALAPILPALLAALRGVSALDQDNPDPDPR